MKFLVMNGPNLNLLGQREPGIYGRRTYEDLCRYIGDYAAQHGSSAVFFQSNHEGALIDAIHDAQGKFDAIILNPAAYTHYSYAILDALKAVDVPAYEVHLSHIDQREAFRSISVTAPACVGQIYGLGFDSYLRAMDFFLEHRPANRLCVIGDPVAHSKSPAIQNAMLKALNREEVYSYRTVTLPELPQFVASAKAGEWLGFNATMPHKEALLPLLDEIDEEAKLIGAVNTVTIENGKAVGHNTDGRGFLAALEQSLGIRPEGKRVTILGAGGAAKAVAVAFTRQGAVRVNVCNRHLERAQELSKIVPEIICPAGFDDETLCNLMGQTDIFINCTSLGMSGKGQFEHLDFLHALPAESAVCDLVYQPMETELLKAAKESGHPVMGGLGMLIHQAIYALEHFLGEPLDHGEMAKIASQAVGN